MVEQLQGNLRKPISIDIKQHLVNVIAFYKYDIMFLVDILYNSRQLYIAVHSQEEGRDCGSASLSHWGETALEESGWFPVASGSWQNMNGSAVQL